ncbi:MAG: hypothetical protein IKQ35_03220 [Bacilli bacterium]|nr:hypothetical protein [Bacilli bacterium]
MLNRIDKLVIYRTNKYIEKRKISEKEKQKQKKLFKEVMNIKDKYKRYSKMHDYICDYLDKVFYHDNACEFHNNICAHRKYMIEHGIKKDVYEDGCCYGYKEGKVCNKLKNGRCTIRNVACKLFTCPYLKITRGVRYSLDNIYLSKYLLNRRQKLYLTHTYFVEKDIILDGLMKRV